MAGHKGPQRKVRHKVHEVLCLLSAILTRSFVPISSYRDKQHGCNNSDLPQQGDKGNRSFSAVVFFVSNVVRFVTLLLNAVRTYSESRFNVRPTNRRLNSSIIVYFSIKRRYIFDVSSIQLIEFISSLYRVYIEEMHFLLLGCQVPCTFPAL